MISNNWITDCAIARTCNSWPSNGYRPSGWVAEHVWVPTVIAAGEKQDIVHRIVRTVDLIDLVQGAVAHAQQHVEFLWHLVVVNLDLVERVSLTIR